MIAEIFLIAWFACGLLAGLAFYRYFQSEWPSLANRNRLKDLVGAFVWFILGPLTLAAEIITGGFKHGINPFRKP